MIFILLLFIPKTVIIKMSILKKIKYNLLKVKKCTTTSIAVSTLNNTRKSLLIAHVASVREEPLFQAHASCRFSDLYIDQSA